MNVGEDIIQSTTLLISSSMVRPRIANQMESPSSLTCNITCTCSQGHWDRIKTVHGQPYIIISSSCVRVKKNVGDTTYRKQKLGQDPQSTLWQNTEQDENSLSTAQTVGLTCVGLGSLLIPKEVEMVSGILFVVRLIFGQGIALCLKQSLHWGRQF